MQDDDRIEQLSRQLEAARQRIMELEATLQEKEERYRYMFEENGDSIFIVDAATLQIKDANLSAARRLGYDRKELLQVPFDEIEVVAEDTEYKLIWESSLSGTKVYECMYRRKDGVEVPVEVSSRIVRYDGETLLINFVRDITARKQAQEQLHLSHDRLDVLRQVDAELSRRLDVQYVAMMALDAAIRLSSAPAGYIGLVEREGVRVLQAIGSYPQEFTGSILPVDGGIAWRVMEQQQAELVEDTSQDSDYIERIPETCALIAIPLISHRRLMGVLCLETHVSESFTYGVFEFLKLLTVRVAVAVDNAHMFEEREQLIQELEAFAHTVAHDLKNPLGSVIGYAEWLLEMYDIMADEKRMRYLQTIARNGNKMKGIIEALLSLASVRTMEEVTVSRLNMSQIVAEVKGRLIHVIEESQAQLTLPKSGAWPAALGYAPWVEEVWANYLSNALKYGHHEDEPPCIELGADAPINGEVRFWVRDEGPGIASEDQTKLFAPFTRVGKSAVEGHGLGLSIVQRIVEKLGGEVSIESRPDEGCTFSFTLPAAE